ncbi:MAG: hypothetical protein ACO307_13600, partial [Ilumatobacteraceae bacterium]
MSVLAVIEHDRGTLAGKLAHWLLSDKTQLQSPEKILPKAKYRLGFNVVDEATGEQVWRPAEGGEAMSAEQWSQAAETEAERAASEPV